ncbi:DUF3078 domain-containing protein [Flavobacterium sp. CBA20B-1]|uniref:DUF3078 domain-containing protein n=1 Tax=unclassified Flavobacterium TaxID=196869 RepID=UPI0022249569|nr:MULTISPECIES: DUF3078 domain-containing protein [unclassified Flavobacterium]WCM40836.1 DUF3078 domain-containing protein [Flavobacterium sp. CBA20B-1]
MFKFKIVVFFLMISAIGFSQPADTLLVKKPKIDIDTFYRTQFSVFDTLVKKNDTIFIRPITVEPKMVLQDSVLTSFSAGNVHQVVLSTFEVTKRNKNSDLAYFLIPKPEGMVYDRTPRANSQILYDALSPVRSEMSFWKKTNTLGLDINQGTFSNWNAGGFSSISGIVKGDFTRKYERGRTIWVNELKVRYGLNKQENLELRKTDDVLTINSSFGYKTSVKSNWYYSAKVTLNTQMANGYAYPNVEVPISRALAPAYLFAGIGSEYSKNNFKAYISPLTLKSTLVLDDALANSGAFGLEGGIFDTNGNLLQPGKKSRNELGFLFTTEWNKSIMNNVNLKNNLTLYTDYLNNFGNIDIDWQLQLEMKINSLLKATLGGHLIYDDDIKNKRDVDGVQITEGPRVQFKQLLSVGLVYNF